MDLEWLLNRFDLVLILSAIIVLRSIAEFSTISLKSVCGLLPWAHVVYYDVRSFSLLPDETLVSGKQKNFQRRGIPPRM